MNSSRASIDIAQPRLFTMGAVATVNAYGLLLMVPLLVAILAVSVIRLGLLTVLIPLLLLAVTAFFLPFGLGNMHICRLVRALSPAAGKGEDGFIVQMTLSPRIRSGLRAVLEDADDIGYLTFTATELVFQGDSVKASVPFARIEEVRPRNIGLRGAFVYGPRIEVLVSGWPEVSSLEFAERSSWLLPASRRITGRLYEHLSATASRSAG